MSKLVMVRCYEGAEKTIRAVNPDAVSSVEPGEHGDYSFITLLEQFPVYSTWVPQDDRAPRGPGGMATGGGGQVRLTVTLSVEQVMECLNTGVEVNGW